MAVFYTFAGINHFTRPKMYLKIIPPFIPAPMIVVYVSGAAEVLLGLMLYFTSTAKLAAWGIIALLIAVFPANIYMYQKGGDFFKMPQWVLIVRLPLQLLLIAWAYWYTV
jgi:uncharacterized membrane protein